MKFIRVNSYGKSIQHLDSLSPGEKRKEAFVLNLIKYFKMAIS